jgi:hypothetical protein
VIHTERRRKLVRLLKAPSSAMGRKTQEQRSRDRTAAGEAVLFIWSKAELFNP